MNFINIRPVFLIMFAVSLTFQSIAGAQEAETKPLNEPRQAQRLKQQFARELAKLQKLEEQLNGLADAHQKAADSGDKIRALQQKYAYVQLKKKYDTSLLELQKLQRLYKSLEARQVDREVAEKLSPANDNNSTSNPVVVADNTVREPNPGHSVEALLQEEHALFNRRLTLEAGITYSHYDRKQLVLNGFLALDAIFLGNIALEGVETDIFRYDFSARYGLSDRMNVNLNVPFIQRTTNYQKGGAGGSSAIVGETEVNRYATLGDASLGMSYQLIKEGPNTPDVVWNVSLTGPSGEHPYGVDTVEHPTSEQGVVLEVPEELPTGSGVWTVMTGASFVRTLDPAIIFANLSYSNTLRERFRDIQSEAADDNQPDQPGEIDLGNTVQYGVGIAFAFNDQLSMNITYSQAITSVSRTKKEGEDRWVEIIGSRSNSATLGIGATYAMSKHLAMVTSVGSGLTEDAPDLTFSIKFPYMF